jgi:hypothetical protein
MLRVPHLRWRMTLGRNVRPMQATMASGRCGQQRAVKHLRRKEAVRQAMRATRNGFTRDFKEFISKTEPKH